MGTNANGYEIRLTILQMAKDMLHEQWHNAQGTAMHNASLTSTPVEKIAAPTFAEIEELAGKLYGFVQDRGDSPRPTVQVLRNPALHPDGL